MFLFLLILILSPTLFFCFSLVSVFIPSLIFFSYTDVDMSAPICTQFFTCCHCPLRQEQTLAIQTKVHLCRAWTILNSSCYFLTDTKEWNIPSIWIQPIRIGGWCETCLQTCLQIHFILQHQHLVSIIKPLLIILWIILSWWLYLLLPWNTTGGYMGQPVTELLLMMFTWHKSTRCSHRQLVYLFVSHFASTCRLQK